MTTYQSISDAILERAIGAREKYSEFETIHSALIKLAEERGEVDSEYHELRYGNNNGSGFDEVVKRLRDELVDEGTVVTRAIYACDAFLQARTPEPALTGTTEATIAKSKLGEVGK